MKSAIRSAQIKVSHTSQREVQKPLKHSLDVRAQQTEPSASLRQQSKMAAYVSSHDAALVVELASHSLDELFTEAFTSSDIFRFSGKRQKQNRGEDGLSVGRKLV